MVNQHKYHYIYKTTCKVDGKFYIGMHSTSNLEDGYIGSGKRLWRSIKKYGKENHECQILEFLPDRISLIAREKELVNESMLQDPMCMNLALGGEGGFINKSAARAGAIGMNKKNWSDSEFINRKRIQTAERNRELHKLGILKPPPNWLGKKHKQESKDKIGLGNSISQKGEKNSQYGKKWIYNIEEKRSIRISKDDIVPDGWDIGRKMFK
jgi:hypothetical protein